MKVLITGSAGFVGRHLALEALDREDDVTLVDLATGADAMMFFAATQEDFDVVFHCAAFVNGREGIDGKPAFMHTYNTMLDAAMFTFALRNRIGRVVYFSSSAAYPLEYQDYASADMPLEEKDIDFHGIAPPEATYGLSKLHGEQMAASVRASGVPVTVLRPFSGYGADQDTRYPFRAFLERAQSRQDPFPIWGDGTQQRDWIHIDDLVGAAYAAVDNSVDGPVNVCTGRGTSFIDLANMFMAAAGYHAPLQFMHGMAQGVQYRVGDPTLLNEFYSPGVKLEDAIAQALEN